VTESNDESNGHVSVAFCCGSSYFWKQIPLSIPQTMWPYRTRSACAIHNGHVLSVSTRAQATGHAGYFQQSLLTFNGEAYSDMAVTIRKVHPRNLRHFVKPQPLLNYKLQVTASVISSTPYTVNRQETRLIKTNQVHFYCLIYSNTRSSTCFE